MLIKPILQSALLEGKVAIVTGGSRGIGGATSEMLAANGAHVVIADVDQVSAQQAVENINACYGANRASAFCGDLVTEGICDQLVSSTFEKKSRLDIVVNNAGYAWDSRIHNMSDEQFQAMLDIHLIVPFRIARTCAPYFKSIAENEAEPDYRKFIMVSSLAGQWGLAGAGNYASAKAGMLGLMRTLAQEWGKYRVNSNAVAFGIIQTRFGLPQTDAQTIESGGRIIHVGMSEKQASQLGLKMDVGRTWTNEEMYSTKKIPGVPLGRSGSIREAAESIFYLASPLSNYVTGQCINVSGGSRGGMS